MGQKKIEHIPVGFRLRVLVFCSGKGQHLSRSPQDIVTHDRQKDGEPGRMSPVTRVPWALELDRYIIYHKPRYDGNYVKLWKYDILHNKGV